MTYRSHPAKPAPARPDKGLNHPRPSQQFQRSRARPQNHRRPTASEVYSPATALETPIRTLGMIWMIRMIWKGANGGNRCQVCVSVYFHEYRNIADLTLDSPWIPSRGFSLLVLLAG